MYGSGIEKWLDRFGAATGLRTQDFETAITQPKKVAYVEETLRSMEQGSLKIRVRSLENEQALARLALSQGITNKLLVASVLLNLGLACTAVPSLVCYAGAVAMAAQGAGGALQVKLFDKRAAKYESKDFEGDN